MSVDGWSNVRNDPIVSCSITNMYGDSMLAATEDTSGHSHTGDYLNEVALKVIEECEKDYQVKVRSFVTDNVGNVSVLRRNLENNERVDVIQYGCSAHLLTLLAHDITTASVHKHVVKIVKYFRYTQLPAAWYK